MSIDAIASAINSAASASQGITGGAYGAGSSTSSLGGSDFMLVLLAQLKNQNPLEPLQDKDLIAQMAQLNSLETLQTINAGINQLTASTQAAYAASLIGKTVKAALADGTTVEGMVSEISVENGTYMLKVGDKSIPIGAVNSVSITQTSSAQTVKAT